MVRILYEVDGGPVDALWQVYRGGDLWFDGFVPLSMSGDQPARSGALGGVEAGNACFYAYQGHDGGDDAGRRK